MKRFLLIVFLFPAFIQLSYAIGTDTVKVREVVNRIQNKYAPDRRVAFFKANILSADPLVLNIETTEPDAIKELKSVFASEKIKAIIEESLLPSKTLNGLVYGIANLSVCNNRFGPYNAAEMATQVLLGTPVQILKKTGKYYFIRTPDNYLSWSEDAGIAEMNEEDYQSWQQAEKVVFTAMYGNSYSQASEKSLPVSDLVAGNILKLLGKEKKFYKVGYPDGRTAYIPAKNLTKYTNWISRPNPTSKEILNTAQQLIGIPYLWGGTSIKALDCSGFTKTSYFLNGIILPRDASQQVLYGEPVDIYKNDTISIEKCMQNLKPGDLLFFAARKNTVPNARITHTAIYMGEGKFIQAAGLVRINSLLITSKDYDDQVKTLISARRMLTAIGAPGISRVDKHSFYSSSLK